MFHSKETEGEKECDSRKRGRVGVGVKIRGSWGRDRGGEEQIGVVHTNFGRDSFNDGGPLSEVSLTNF